MQLLVQFYSDSFKLHRCLGHGLKMCMLFGYNPQIRFCLVFLQNELSNFSGRSKQILGILCMQLLQQFYSDSFEKPWSEYVPINRILS